MENLLHLTASAPVSVVVVLAATLLLWRLFPKGGSFEMDLKIKKKGPDS